MSKKKRGVDWTTSASPSKYRLQDVPSSDSNDEIRILSKIIGIALEFPDVESSRGLCVPVTESEVKSSIASLVDFVYALFPFFNFVLPGKRRKTFANTFDAAKEIMVRMSYLCHEPKVRTGTLGSTLVSILNLFKILQNGLAVVAIVEEEPELAIVEEELAVEAIVEKVDVIVIDNDDNSKDEIDDTDYVTILPLPASGYPISHRTLPGHSIRFTSIPQEESAPVVLK